MKNYSKAVKDNGQQSPLLGHDMTKNRAGGKFETIDNCHPIQEQQGLLQTVFKDGKLVKETTFSEIRRKLQ